MTLRIASIDFDRVDDDEAGDVVARRGSRPLREKRGGRRVRCVVRRKGVCRGVALVRPSF